jgi:cytochrome c biogenesis protein CcdA
MPDLFSDPPYILLILGFGLFFGAVVSTCTGKTLARFRGLVYRAKDPSDFWWVVTIYFLGAVLFIGLFLYEAHWFSD